MGGKKKDPTHGMAQVALPEEIRAALRPAQGARVAAAERSLRNPANRSTQEQIDFLRGELGRAKRRLRDLEDQAKAHAHPVPDGPPLRNGMWIDERGQYWMRRPDGWHFCYIMPSIEKRPGGVKDSPVAPLQRLAEPRGERPLR